MNQEAILALEAGLPGEPIPQRLTAAERPMNRLTPISPGELLQEEFLEPLGISQYRSSRW
jgi:hypothetical protein